VTQQTLNPPPVYSPFTTGDASDKGDPPNALVVKLQAMLTELYSKATTFTKYTTNAASGAATAAAGDLTGAQSVVANYSAVGAANLTTRTAAQMFADAGAIVGQTYEVEIMNSSGGTTTLVGGTGVTINGTATIAAGTARWFAVTFNSATTMTFQNLGSGSI
jgi:hypothetical protein